MSSEVKPEQKRFGRFVVTGVLGEGAMGTVFSAHDEMLDRVVAIKTIRPTTSGSLRDELFRKRFQHEARAVAALAHSNIVQLFEMGFEGDAPYLVMEMIRGRSLRDRVDSDGPLSMAEARTLGIQIARALQAAHEQGVMHRDVKPANILEAEPGLWKLSDFGVAHVPSSSITIDGQFVGTPAYAAPEALIEGKFGPATDVYGLGATLYDALTGQPPFGRAALAALGPEAKPAPISSYRGDSSREFDECLLMALAREPEHRPTVAEFASRLASAESVVEGYPVQAHGFVASYDPPPGSYASYPRAQAAVTLSGAPPSAPASASSSRRSLVVSLAAAALLVGIGFYCGSSDSQAPIANTPSQVLPSATGAVEEREALWDDANRKLRDGDVDGALEDTETLMELDPDSPQVQQLHNYLHELQDAQNQPGSRPAKHKGKGKGKGKGKRGER